MHRPVSSCMFRVLVSVLLTIVMAPSAAAEFQQQGANDWVTRVTVLE